MDGGVGGDGFPGGLPAGTVTFLFTDVEGSTRLWQDQPTDMAVALELHDGVVRSLVEENGGHVFATAGGAFALVFGNESGVRNRKARVVRIRVQRHETDIGQRPRRPHDPALRRTRRRLAASRRL